MENYKLKRDLRREVAQDGGKKLGKALSISPRAVLPWEKWQQYEPIDPANAQLQVLINQTIGQNWWRLLWIPPTMPYYCLSHPFTNKDPASITKKLIFSSWHVVPRAIPAMLSYEAERRMVRSFEPGATNTSEARTRRSRRRLLTFALSQGRLTGMEAS